MTDEERRTRSLKEYSPRRIRDFSTITPTHVAANCDLCLRRFHDGRLTLVFFFLFFFSKANIHARSTCFDIYRRYLKAGGMAWLSRIQRDCLPLTRREWRAVGRTRYASHDSITNNGNEYLYIVMKQGTSAWGFQRAEERHEYIMSVRSCI